MPPGRLWGRSPPWSGLLPPVRPDHARLGSVQHLSTEAFEEAVADALDTIPASLTEAMDNVVVLIEPEPPSDAPELLGVYDGTPLTERGDWWAAGALPDRITIFQGPLERMCESADELREEIAIAVEHEVAHHFGLDDEHRLARLEE